MAYLKINGTDYSALLNKYDWVETPRQIQGKNVGASINGSDIYDIVATKYDFSHKCRPMTAATYKLLCELMESNPVTVEYDSAAADAHRSVTALMTVSAATKCIETSEHVFFNDIVLSFRQK